jgi:hypothetical protein
MPPETQKKAMKNSENGPILASSGSGPPLLPFPIVHQLASYEHRAPGIQTRRIEPDAGEEVHHKAIKKD